MPSVAVIRTYSNSTLGIYKAVIYCKQAYLVMVKNVFVLHHYPSAAKKPGRTSLYVY